MMPRALAAIVGTTLMVSAMWSGRAPETAAGTQPANTLLGLGRSLVRPWVLPLLWNQLERASRNESTADYVGTGRFILQLIPDWIDGHVHLAWQLAFDRLASGPDPEVELDRLLDALALLEQSRQQTRDRHDELLAAMSSILEIRCRQNELLARRFQARLGKDPFAVAQRLLDQATRLRPTPSRSLHRAFLQRRVIAGRIRMQDRAAADVLTRQTLADLATMAETSSTTALRRSMLLLQRYLAGEPTIHVEDLANDPYLTEIAAAILESQADK